MSLQVWLPLTKDLRQQGLSNVTVTNNGATFNSAGKLGGCYSFGTGNSYITVDSTPLKTFTEFSFACWVKIISWNTSYSTIFAVKNSTGVSWNNLIFSLLRNSSNSTLCFNISNGSNYTSTSCQTGTLSLNTWYHITCTYKSGEIKLYQDGNVVSTYNTSVVPNFNSIVNLWIGKSNENSYQSNNLLNDVRIYSHCLSPMEVKELSKGLVLHYPLNRGGWGQENLLSRYVVPGQAAPTSTAAGGRTTWLGDYKIIIPATENADTYFRLFTTKQLTTNATYTISCQVDGLLDGTYYRFPLYAQGNTSMGVLELNHNGLCSLTFTMTYGTQTAATGADGETVYICFMDDSGRAIASGQEAITVSNFKLEEGSIATPWCPNSSDVLATTMGLNGTTEYDCSGYCNNGTQWAYDTAGAISYVSDTPKYNISTFIDSSNNTTNTASGTRYIYGNCELATPSVLTCAFWCKPIAGYGSSTGQGQFSLTNNVIGASAGQDYDTSPMNHRDSVVDMCTSSGTHKYVSITFTANEWHHYVVVYDGRYGRVYKDGVATGATLDMGSVLPLKDMKGVVIGFSKAGGVWRSNKSYFSDFRIYATALSADDIQSLYQNSAYIDSSGNVYGAVHSEV